MFLALKHTMKSWSQGNFTGTGPLTEMKSLFEFCLVPSGKVKSIDWRLMKRVSCQSILFPSNPYFLYCFNVRAAEEDSWDSNASHCPTGQVVAIRQRSSANIVAALLQDSVGEIGGGKRLLVCPFDRRIPKIRLVSKESKGAKGSLLTNQEYFSE